MHFRGFLFFAFAIVAHAEGDVTALGAIRLLPKDAAKRLAKIEARDAAPVPERWYLLVHDPAVPRGLREFVVAGGKMVASRTLSQFADSLQAADVFGADSVKFDSDKVARIASFFAMANGGRLASLNFEMTRISGQAGPVWRATVLDSNGDQLGVLVLTAAKGAIVSYDGFQKLPPAELVNLTMAETAPPSAAPARSRPLKKDAGIRATPVPAQKAGLPSGTFGVNSKPPAPAPR